MRILRVLHWLKIADRLWNCFFLIWYVIMQFLVPKLFEKNHSFTIILHEKIFLKYKRFGECLSKTMCHLTEVEHRGHPYLGYHGSKGKGKGLFLANFPRMVGLCDRHLWNFHGHGCIMGSKKN